MIRKYAGLLIIVLRKPYIAEIAIYILLDIL